MVPGVSERTLLLVVLTGLKLAVTPPGSPETARVTLPLKPFLAVTLIVLLWLLLPIRRVRALAEDERLKSCAGTVTTIVVVFVAAPEVPVITTG